MGNGEAERISEGMIPATNEYFGDNGLMVFYQTTYGAALRESTMADILQACNIVLAETP